MLKSKKFNFLKKGGLKMLNFGNVASCDGSKKVDIIVKCNKESIRDIVLGSALIGAGVVYLTMKTFVNGAKALETAELIALAKINAIS